MKSDKKLAGIFVRRGLLTEEQRNEVMAEADGKSLSEILLERKIVEENDIISCVSQETNLPPIDLAKVTIDEALLEIINEKMAKKYLVLPVARVGKLLTVAVADPFDVMVVDDLRLSTGHEPIMAISSEAAIARGIERVYASAEADMQDVLGEMDTDAELELADTTEEEVDIGAELAESGSGPVVKLVNLTIAEAVKAGASGIHIEPYEKRTRVRYRIDGACVEKMSPPKSIHHAVASRIKILAGMDIGERRRPQDGSFKMKYKGREIDFRVSILPQVYGEKVAMRVLDASVAQWGLDSLGLEEKALADIDEAIHAANGMVLVTGPTGCGKTTTLYAAIKKIVSVEDNITSVEDPVEYSMDGVNQVQVNERRGLTFASALRSILRQDPDKVLIGEIRDQETAGIAVKAALTGHLVLSTLHTNDAPKTITRLMNMGIDGFLLASTLILACSQRLVRRLCPECKTSSKSSEENMREWGFTEEEAAASPDLFVPGGCGRCNKLGYKGRLGIMETLPLTEGIRDIVSRGGSAVEIKEKAVELGMLTLRRVGILNAIRGNTSMQEVLSSTMPDR